MPNDTIVRRNRTSFPPCFDYRYFQSLGQVIMNDEMARLFTAELANSGETHELILSLRRDLDGMADNPFWPEPENSYDPCYDFTYFRGRSTITFNKSAARIISEALNKSNQQERIHPALWTMNTDIYRFYKQPSSAISQAAYNIWKFAEKRGAEVHVPLEQYNALCSLFERKEQSIEQEV